MRFIQHCALALTVSLLFVSQVFATDWGSLLPEGNRRAGTPDVVPTQKVLTVGETLVLPLPGSKSYRCPVEVDGDSVRIVAHNPLESVTLQGVTPGKSEVRIYRKFWRDPDVADSYQLIQVLEIAVQSGFKESLLLEWHDRNEQTIPLPVRKGDLEWEGNLSRQGQELLTVITDSTEWQSLWQSAFGATAPEVDFNKYGIACVFLGFQADWLYGIEFAEPCLEGGLQVIPYDLIEIILELEGPFRASGQYHMKAYEKKSDFGMIVRKGSCKAQEQKRDLLPE
ncbi:MAG: hypothetical protein EG822_16525 [Deltaproteobacteria bacterium]|nr:hypothetical protein [Deltaproteobacteria bacterium]TLN00732.1 MAG: hypothetical protein FDZ73_18465 [bacterium]